MICYTFSVSRVTYRDISNNLLSSVTKSYYMKRAILVTAILFATLTSCKKSKKPDGGLSFTNAEITATSTGTFTVKLVQTSPTYGVRYTLVGADKSDLDKKLLLNSRDGLEVNITNATAPVHTMVKYNNKTLIDVTTTDEIHYSTAIP